MVTHLTPHPSTIYNQRDDDSPTPMPQSVCRPDDCPMADRVARIERTVDGHTRDLGKGAVTMTRLEGNLDRLTDSINRLEAAVDKFQSKSETPNKYSDKVITALINVGVPAGLIMAVWLAVKSGVIAVHP
jgi:hypothetical protein